MSNFQINGTENLHRTMKKTQTLGADEFGNT